MEEEKKINENEEKKGLPMSEELISLLDYIKENLTQELPTLSIDLEYFILGVLVHKDNDLFKRLNWYLTSSSLDAIYQSFYQVVSSRALSAVRSNRKISLHHSLADALLEADKVARSMGAKEVTSEHVFLSILLDENEENKVRKVFNKAGLTYSIMKNKMTNGDDETTTQPQTQMPKRGTIKIVNLGSKQDAEKFFNSIAGVDVGDESGDFGALTQIGGVRKKNKNSYIAEYCSDLNEMAENGKMEPLIGRDKEVGQIFRVLGRKKKNNIILVGGEGVGKTAIGESIAYKIAHGEAPEFLFGRRLVSLDMTALMAGTTLRGMFEERVKGILDEIKANPKYILFMDNIGAMLADKGKNDYDISSMLMRSLENGEVQVIGTSDFSSFRTTFDKDPSLSRRFQKLVIEAPSIKDSINIINGLAESYEEFHNVKYEKDALEACVYLADRYIPERNLPDSAIDIMDEAGAYYSTMRENEALYTMRKAINELERSINALKKEKDYSKADSLTNDLIKQKKEYNEMRNKVKAEAEQIVVSKEDILNIVSLKTDVPVNSLTSDDKKHLVDMNERIKADVIGQDEAIDTICKAIKRNRVGIHNGGCMCSFMAIGRTGVGKTLIAKKLAKELFGDENALVRFDMSEYSDKVSVNKLIGSNPGYVGYEEGGQLTETIKNRKHCVLLLDEIEKADPEIYNIFLQVLDEGFLTDNSGMKVDFKNVIVIFTSNIGAKAASDFGKGIGFNEDENANTKKILTRQLKNKFPPEFLNRIDDIIYFNSLTDDNLRDIIKLEIGKLSKRLASIGYDLSYDDCVVEHIFDIVKEEKEFGARPIMRAIQDEIEDKITDTLLENDYENGHLFKISCCPDESEVVVA